MLKGIQRAIHTFRNIDNPGAYLRYKWGGKKGDFTFKADHGISLTVPKRLLPTFKERFFRVPYREGMPAEFIRRKDPIVVDIGANVGFFSFYVLSKFPKARIWAFEPFPPNHRLLSDYADQHPQFHLMAEQKAVASASGSLELAYDPTDSFSTSASLLAEKTGSHQATTIEVPTVTLPQVLEDNKLDRIDWLKVDCEGAEYQIFSSLTPEFLSRVGAITVETHDSEKEGENPEAIIAQLRANGFQVKTNSISPLIWAWKKS